MSRILDSIRRARSAFMFQPDGDPGPPVDPHEKRVLLVYLFGAMGDALLLAPAVKALLARGVAQPVGLILRPNAARIFKHVDLPVRIHTLPDALYLPAEREDDPKRARAWKKAEVKAAASKLARALAAKKYEVAVELTARADVDARRWIKSSGATTRLGFIDAGETAASARLTWPTPDERVQAERHWSKYLVLPLRSLGVDRPDYEVPLITSAAQRKKAEAQWDEGPRVLLVPGAASPEKRWSEDRFVRVGRFVTQERHGTVVVCGAPGEAALIKSVVEQIGAGASAYTQKDLGALIELVRGAHAVVTNDTGPMHIAFLAKVPTVAVFTWMSRVCWGPPDADPRFVVLNAPESERAGGDSPDGVWTRAVIHYLGGLLDTYGPKSGR